MNTVKEINRINERELELGLANKGSWHDAYKDSAYVFVGGLNYEMTEGDVITVFSQWGEIVDISMPRDKETHKPKGFAFVMYEDQRSTVLAVDNMNGAQVLGRTVRVDHCKKYSQPGTRNAEGEYQEPEAPSYNAMPPILSDSEDDGEDDDTASEGSGAAGGGGEDEADPMAKFLRAERKREKEEKRMLEGGGGVGTKRKRDEAEKEAKRRRKEERARIRAERERKKRSKGSKAGDDDRKREPALQEERRRSERSRSNERRRTLDRSVSPPPRRPNRDYSPQPTSQNGHRNGHEGASRRRPVDDDDRGDRPSGRDDEPRAGLSRHARNGDRPAETDRDDRRRGTRSPERRGEDRQGRANKDDWRQGRWELERERERDTRDSRDAAPRRGGPNDLSPAHERGGYRNGGRGRDDDGRHGYSRERYRDDSRDRHSNGGDRRY